MTKIKIDLDFEELDKLPFEEYNKLEEKYLRYLEWLIDSAERDYCRKRGTIKSKIMKNYVSYKKMMNAINNRKAVKKATETCMRFNRMLRPYIKEKSKEKQNDAL